MRHLLSNEIECVSGASAEGVIAGLALIGTAAIIGAALSDSIPVIYSPYISTIYVDPYPVVYVDPFYDVYYMDYGYYDYDYYDGYDVIYI